MCGASSSDVRVIAHHVVGLSECPEAKLEPSNGMALCVLCHDIVHDTVGYHERGWAGVRRMDVSAT